VPVIDPSSNLVPFHYLKSGHFHTIHVDGAYGGPTPRGLFSMALFSERNPLPQKEEYEVGDDGKLGERKGRTGRDGIIRELEVVAMMTVETAKLIRDWLSDQIQAMDDRKDGAP
jgi:hypothetical protein